MLIITAENEIVNRVNQTLFPLPMHFPIHGQWWSYPSIQVSQILQWNVFSDILFGPSHTVHHSLFATISSEFLTGRPGFIKIDSIMKTTY